MTPKILRPQQVCEMLSISIPTLYREMKKEGFPSKIRISSKAVGFKEEDISNWIESRTEK